MILVDLGSDRPLQPYGILEVARSGLVALTRDSGVNTLLLEEVEDDAAYYA